MSAILFQKIKTTTSTFEVLSKILSFIVVVVTMGVLPESISAQESLTLSVTPTLFEIAALPEQEWQSSVKVVNSNNFPLTVYVQAVNFAPQNESGHGKFIPVLESVTGGSTLAEWIVFEKTSPLEMQPLSSLTIPFTVTIPTDAAPGGHFAAILVGTQPPQNDGALIVRTSQIVSSLFFLRVEGDVIESGSIRTFSVVDSFTEKPHADFELRFENKGNVHLQPQGQITIRNMWGKERGTIPINMQTHFGNVLPNSIRKFEFTWDGAPSIADIGRYTAEVGLAYGTSERKFESSEATFWVVPLKPVLGTLLFIAAFIYFVVWIVRTYVRRMLMIAGLDPDRSSSAFQNTGRSRIIYEGDVMLPSYRQVTAPVRFGIADLRTRLTGLSGLKNHLTAMYGFAIAYKLFFAAALIAVGSGVVLYYYFGAVMVSTRDFAVNIRNPESSVTLNAEEIEFASLTGTSVDTPITEGDHPFVVKVINTSSYSGTAGRLGAALHQVGYDITSLSFDQSRIDERTVIVYDPPLESSALELSRVLGGALLSSRGVSESDMPTLTIYAGKDQLEK